jgi:hypothetical protein
LFPRICGLCQAANFLGTTANLKKKRSFQNSGTAPLQTSLKQIKVLDTKSEEDIVIFLNLAFVFVKRLYRRKGSEATAAAKILSGAKVEYK